MKNKNNQKDNDLEHYKFNHILIIDDSVVDVEVLSLVLSFNNFGKKISKFYSAPKALEFIQNVTNEIPDLIFLDINMPEMDGFEFLDEIEKIPSLENKFKVIIFSSSNDMEDFEKAKTYKVVTKYWVKPIKGDYLNDL